MNTEENNDAPVLNVEETQTGEGLVESAGTSENNEETPKVENNEEAPNQKEEEEIEAFDPSAFMERNVDVEDNGNGEGKEENDDDAQSWPDLPTENTESTESESSNSENGEANAEGSETPESQSANIDNDQFKLFTKELGLEADSIDEVKDALASILEENAKLKEGSIPKEKNKRIEDLEKFSKLDDTDLVRKSLEADGLTGDKLDHTIDRLLDSGLIDVEALKIRNNVDKAIQSERHGRTGHADQSTLPLLSDR